MHNYCISILLHFSIKSILTYKKLHSTKINNMSLRVPLTTIYFMQVHKFKMKLQTKISHFHYRDNLW
jgi:hypothetical protein